MEVILRKTKISKSILDQTYIASESELKTYEVLGWCLVTKPKYSTRYILLYNAAKQNLAKYKFSSEINEGYNNEYISREGHRTPKTWYVDVKYNGGWSPSYYRWESEKEQKDFVSNLKRVEKEAINKGQIFI